MQYKDFTTDPTNFPASAMKEFISDLHNNGKHFGKDIISHFIKTNRDM